MRRNAGALHKTAIWHSPRLSVTRDSLGTRLCVLHGTDDSFWLCGVTYTQLYVPTICLCVLQTHYGSVCRVTWAHPEFGELLATCSFDRTTAIWEEQGTCTSFHCSISCVLVLCETIDTYKCTCTLLNPLTSVSHWSGFNSLPTIRNSLKKQKPCTKV